jgi:hypothetical protein
MGKEHKIIQRLNQLKTMKKKKKTTKKAFDTRKFIKMFLIKFSYRVMELAILFFAGWSVGLKLIRY